MLLAIWRAKSLSRTRGTKDGGGLWSLVQVSGIFLFIIGFLGFPRSPLGNFTLDPEKQAECSRFVWVKVPFYLKKIFGIRPYVLPRALMSEVFQSVCNCFLSSSKVLNEWILRNRDKTTTRSNVDLCSFLVFFRYPKFFFFSRKDINRAKVLKNLYMPKLTTAFILSINLIWFFFICVLRDDIPFTELVIFE